MRGRSPTKGDKILALIIGIILFAVLICINYLMFFIIPYSGDKAVNGVAITIYLMLDVFFIVAFSEFILDILFHYSDYYENWDG